jgi:7-carboxy-7-deazaguanine synthase
VLLETNGSLGISKVPGEVIKILDIKCPDSGMHERMDFKNLHFLSPRDEVKFVLSSRADYDWAVAIIDKYRLDRTARLLFSPVSGRLDPPDLAEWLLSDQLPARLQLQLHKNLWPAATRGK